MIISIVALGVLSIAPKVVAHTPLSNQGAPQIKCEISMPAWCIATFGGTIALADSSDTRIWSLQSENGMPMGPLVIIESKLCSVTSDYNVSLVKRSIVKGKSERPEHSVVFELGSAGCQLDFRWPASVDNDFAYKNLMLYGILVGKDKRQQLYKYANRVRYRGRFVEPSK